MSAIKEIVASCATEAQAHEARRVARVAAYAAYKAGTAGASSFRIINRCVQSLNSRGQLVEDFVFDVVKMTNVLRTANCACGARTAAPVLTCSRCS